MDESMKIDKEAVVVESKENPKMLKGPSSSEKGSEGIIDTDNTGSEPSQLPEKSPEKLDFDGDTIEKMEDRYNKAFELEEANIANLKRSIADKQEEIRQIRAAERAGVSDVLIGPISDDYGSARARAASPKLRTRPFFFKNWSRTWIERKTRRSQTTGDKNHENYRVITSR